MDIILFGMQGSGKGTQGKILAERYGLKIFEMGGALRAMIASGSELGNSIKATVEAGNLVSDDIIMQVVEEFLNTEGKGSNHQREYALLRKGCSPPPANLSAASLVNPRGQLLQSYDLIKLPLS